MELKDIGEREAIKIMAELYGSVNLDDCATMDAGDEFFLITTDMVNKRTHFPEGATPYQMGWFVVAINLSDIAAKGGMPVGVTLSLGLPASENINFIKEFSRGADDCAKKFGTKIIGGDTKEMNSITICGTAIGRVKKNMFMPRKGCHPGDVVCVTGELGGAGAALKALENGNDEFVDKVLMVNPRVREGRAAASVHGVTASMDISDGLASSLYQLMEINEKGFSINAGDIPVHEMAEFQKDAIELAIYYGGDYELLFTVSPDKFGDVKKVIESTGCRLTAIGKVIRDKRVMLIKDGKEEVMEKRGYEHFLGGEKLFK